MKNYKNLIVAIVLLALIGIVAKQYFSNNKSTIKGNLSEFSISDTAAVSKIFIADMRGNQILLERASAFKWRLNGKYDATQHNITNLLETIHLMTVKSPVASARYDKTIRDLSTIGIKIEIYMGGSTPHKVLYLGTPNQTHTGTYMMIEGSNLPYLVHIEGFNGFLTPRFSPKENDWRTKVVFNNPPQEIAEIRLSYPGHPEKGFVIKQTIDHKLSLFNNALIPASNWDTGYVYEYVERFRSVNFEMWEETKNPIFIDSVSTSTPLEIYTVTNMAGESTTIKTFKKPLLSGMDIEGNPIDHDQDRMYGLLNDTEFMIIQYFVFDPLNHEITYFNKN